jgi:hypothetical protein
MYSDRPRVNPVQSLNVLVSFYVSFVLVRVARRNLGNPSGTKGQMNEKGGKKDTWRAIRQYFWGSKIPAEAVVD